MPTVLSLVELMAQFIGTGLFNCSQEGTFGVFYGVSNFHRPGVLSC